MKDVFKFVIHSVIIILFSQHRLRLLYKYKQKQLTQNLHLFNISNFRNSNFGVNKSVERKMCICVCLFVFFCVCFCVFCVFLCLCVFVCVYNLKCSLEANTLTAIIRHVIVSNVRKMFCIAFFLQGKRA